MKRTEEVLVERYVTYTLTYEKQFYIVENVPARVNEQTGEQFFSPKTVEHLQKIVLGKEKPSKMMETPVYEYSA